MTPRLLSMSLMLSACLALPALAQDCDGWVPVGDPGWREVAGAAFDPVSQSVIMFGGGRRAGSTGGATFPDTWSYDGRRWTCLNTGASSSTPPGKLNPLLAYDPASARVLSHGGRASPNASADTSTWSFDGASWSLFATGGPAALSSSAAFCYDPVTASHWCAVPASPSLRLWRLSGGAWSELTPTSGQPWPGTTSTIGAAFDSTRGRLVLFASSTGDVWEFDPTALTWQQTPSAFAPVQFFQITGACDAPALGGVAVNIAYQPRIWNGAGFTNVGGGLTPQLSTVSPVLFTFADGTPGMIGEFDPANTSAYIRAGTMRVARVGAMQYTVLPSRPAPVSRFWATLAPLPGQGTMLIGGTRDTGSSCSGTPNTSCLGDTWLLRGERWQQIAASGAGTPNNAPLVFDPVESTMVFPSYFSVRSSPTTSAARWSPTGWQPWTFGSAGALGTDANNAVATDQATGRAWVLPQNSATLYARNAGAAAWSSLGAPSGAPVQSYGTLAFDPVRNALISVGHSSGQPTRVYGLATGAWSNIQNYPTSGITPYPGWWGPGSAYDPGRAGVVVFGGFSGNQTGDSSFPRNTYLLPSSGSAWQRLTTTNIPGREYANIAYEPLSERIVLFGGYAFYDFGDTWKLARGPAGIAVHPSPVTSDAGTNTSFEVVAKGGGVIRYQWRRNGVPLVESARIDGVHTDLLTIAGLRASDIGDYTCVVTNDCGTETSAAAHLAVNGATCPADLGSAGGVPGPDGALDNNDFIAFITYFFNADPHADMGTAGGLPGSDGAFDNNDFIAFINAFFTGC